MCVCVLYQHCYARTLIVLIIASCCAFSQTVWYIQQVILCAVLFVTVVTRKPPHGTERHSSQVHALPLDVGKRNTAYIGNVQSSTQHRERSLARNANNRYGHAVVPSTAGSSFDRPSHNRAIGISKVHVEDGRVHGTPQHSVTPLYYQPATAVTHHPSINSRLRSSAGFGTSYQATSDHLPRSRTSAANLSSSSLGATSCHYHRPLPSDPKSSSRRSLPYTAYRT